MGDGLVIQGLNDSKNDTKNKNKKKKKRGGGNKKKMTTEQTLAFESISPVGTGQEEKKVVFEFHSHSKFSDGFLSPSELVEKAHENGVKVLALTDHDTMSGIPEALEAARKYGIKIIPGVEISTIFSPRGDSEAEEPVHILAYYSSCGPTRFEELDKFLSNIRDGRFLRAKNMVLKLNKLELPLKWEHVCRIAGNGIAPGRLHVARAMLEKGYVENLRQAFARYLFDGGPAYSTGSEPLVEEAIKLICQTGGVAVLAHPWALKNPVPVIKRLKEAGLHGMEVYRSDGKLAVYDDLADTYGLFKVGGSDYHGRGGRNESELGSVNLPVLVLNDFLKVARPIWCKAIREIFESYAEEPSDSNLASIMRFGRTLIFNGGSPLSRGRDLIDHYLPLWLTGEEIENSKFEAIKLKLSNIPVSQEGIQVLIETK
ncbi:uncharacterized protein LOC114713741 isoform X2 [Neltuma alba]|uniref:uncharacterized protein LOC114713741 isoform X2 n=1 Tax=Neltuma alba TaxID=207710 RepID=UPI0010A2FFFF|nr:uncharacterized protein LOC114713741 isoform X2 [Prosopis alba]